MNCRKCGAKRITRRKVGMFVCRRCGVQPGDMQLDRSGTIKLKEKKDGLQNHRD